MLKRYIVFSGEMFYPSGGWFDHRGAFDDLQAANDFLRTVMETEGWDWGQIVDATTGEIVIKVPTDLKKMWG